MVKMEMDDNTAAVLLAVLCASSSAQAEILKAGGLDKETTEDIEVQNHVTGVIIEGIAQNLGIDIEGDEPEVAH